MASSRAMSSGPGALVRGHGTEGLLYHNISEQRVREVLCQSSPFSPAQHLVGFLLALLGLLDLIQGLEGARGQLDRPGTTVWGGKDKQSTPGHMDTAINEMAHALTRRTYCSEPANVASICASCSGPGWPLIGCMISSTKGRPSPSMRTSASSRPPMRVQKGEDMPYCR